MLIPKYLSALKRERIADVTIPDAPIHVPAAAIDGRPTGWRFLGMFYSAIPDPELYVDPAIVAAIRARYDPFFVPLVVKWVFQPPLGRTDSAEMLVFKRHGLANRVPYPSSHKELFHVEMPAGADFPVPNQIYEILMTDWNPENFSTSRHKSITLPGEYVPFTWELFHNPRVILSVKELKRRFIEAPRERMERERAKLLAERERQDQEAERFINRRLEKMSDREIRLWSRALAEVIARKYTERRNAPVSVVLKGAQ